MIQARTREFFIPKGSTKVEVPGSDVVAYNYDIGGKIAAVAFAGKAIRPTYHYTFQTIEARDRKLATLAESRAARAKMNAEYKEKRSAPHTLKEGDILYGTWGYNMTNVNFYIVTRRVSDRSAEIAELAQTETETGFLCGTTVPTLREIGKRAVHVVNGAENSIKLKSYLWISKWGGKPVRFNHCD